ncbi:hypothetical protein HAX54_022354 [Datura stramonium]|uniref:Uncharacterized protein n=1 Tax=Datura stramonium TaxID=4076 RepID=A0ABS8S411_DATST|nr:hypothetical protein [Datura stramonium]
MSGGGSRGGAIVLFYESLCKEEAEWRPNLGVVDFNHIGGENGEGLERAILEEEGRGSSQGCERRSPLSKGDVARLGEALSPYPIAATPTSKGGLDFATPRDFVWPSSSVFSSSPDQLSVEVEQAEKLKDANISEVACRVFESDYKLEPQHCLVCDSYRDLEASCAATSQAESCYKRLQDAIASNEVPTNILLDAVRCTDLLRTIFHPCNKRIAELEDNLAQAFCLVGELQAALDHCKASIQILEKLYDANHIVIGNELIKLASLQILVGDSAASGSISRITAIFLRYYGSHADDIHPYLRYLKGSQDAEKSHILSR